MNKSNIGIIGGLLGAFAGADKTSKQWRRVGIPLFLTLYTLQTLYPIYGLYSLWCITLMFMSIILGIGYGIPDLGDKGSTLGRFWLAVWSRIGLYGSKALVFTNISVRITIAVLICLSLVNIVILRHNWLIYGLGSLSIILVYGLISWRDLGGFNFRGKLLLWSEFWTYFIVVGVAQILIKF